MADSRRLSAVTGIGAGLITATLLVTAFVVSGRASAPWRIGVEAPLSGSQSALGIGILRGVQLAANDVNAAGGAAGRRIEIVPIDDAADPVVGVAAAKAAIASHLDGVIGPYNSSVGPLTLPLYMAAGLVPLRFTTADTTAGMGFTLQPMSSQIAPVASASLSQWMHSRTVAIAFDDSSPYTRGVKDAVVQRLATVNVQVTTTVAFQPGRTSYEDVVQALTADAPDSVYVAAYAPEGGLIARTLAATPSGPACLLDYATYDATYVSVAAESATRCAVLGVPAPEEFAGAAAYVSAYVQTFGSQPGTWSPYGYDSLKLLAAAAQATHGFDRVRLSDYFAGVRNWMGWTGSVSLEPGTGNREPVSLVVTSVRDGQLRTDPGWRSFIAGR